MAQALSMETIYFRPPQIRPPKLIAKKFITGNCVVDFYPNTKCGANLPMGGGFWANR